MPNAASARTERQPERRAPRIDFTRPALEWGRLVQDPLFWGWGARRGDGRDVLVLPGLMGGDNYLATIRSWLRRIGYNPLESGLERNPGWSQELVDEFSDLVSERSQRRGKRVSIVGHSMGGVIARSVAKAHPEAVDRVLTLGSPLRFGTGAIPEGVSLTSIASRENRIVPLSAATARDPGAQTLEVSGSHIGLVFNVEVYRHLSQLLAAPATSEESASRPAFI